MTKTRHDEGHSAVSTSFPSPTAPVVTDDAEANEEAAENAGFGTWRKSSPM